MENRAQLRSVALALLIFSALHTVPSDAASVPNRRSGEEGNYFEGDIRLRPGEAPYNILVKRTVVASSHSIWPNRTVYYNYDPDLAPTYRSRFAEAMDEWERVTCIEFKRPTAADPSDNYLLFSDEDCSSYVGMQGGPQRISINSNCRKVGDAIHEIGHALGLWHEHSRPDRDNYIEIKWDNILLLDSVKESQKYFGKLSMDVFEPIGSLNVMYDFESIMHYDKYAFSLNPGTRPTIQIKDSIKLPSCLGDFQFGQRSRISWRDQLRVNKLYQCTEKVEQLLASKPECDPLVPDPTPPSSSITPTPTAAAPTETPLPTPTSTSTPTPSPTTLSPGERVQNSDSIAMGAGITALVLTLIIIVCVVLVCWWHYQKHRKVTVWMDNVTVAGYMDGNNTTYGYSEELVSIR